MGITDGGYDGPDWNTGTLEARAQFESKPLDLKFGEIVTDLGNTYWNRVRDEKGSTTVADLWKDFITSYGSLYSVSEILTARRLIEAYFGSFHPNEPARSVLESALAGEKHYHPEIPNPPANEFTE